MKIVLSIQRHAWAFACLVLINTAASGDDDSAPLNQAGAGQPSQTFEAANTAKPAARHALIICGHPGDEQHRVLFAETVEKLSMALTTRYGFSTDRVRIRFGGDDFDGSNLACYRGPATREAVEAEAARLRTQLGPEESLWVIVIGHAYYDGRHSYLNLPGPDLHEGAFAKLFENLPAREQVFFITSPASGFYLKPLSAKGRVVISATERDYEVNATFFPHVLAQTLVDPPPAEEFDADADGTLSVFDLYLSVARRVLERYAEEQSISTEHAQIDDNGDGRGSEPQIRFLPPELGGRHRGGAKPTIAEGADGALAARVALSP